MSAPPAPSFFAGTGAVARLALLRTLRGRKLRVAVVATVVVLLFPALVALLEDDADAGSIVTNGIDWGFFRLLSLLLPVLFTSGAIGEEVEGRTLHFLSMRPVSRSSIAIGKYLVGAGASLAVLWAGLILLHVVGYATSPTLMIDNVGATARAGGAASLLVIAYSGICLFWGALVPEAAGMLSVLWLLFFEVFAGLLPSVLRLASLSHYARLLGALEPAGLNLFVPEIQLWVCAVVIVSAWVIFTLLGVLIVQLSELRFGKA